MQPRPPATSARQHTDNEAIEIFGLSVERLNLIHARRRVRDVEPFDVDHYFDLGQRIRAIGARLAGLAVPSWLAGRV